MRGQRLRDPVLLTIAALYLVTCVLFVPLWGHKFQVFWAAQPPLDAALAIGAYRLRSLSSKQYRRFFTSIALAGASFAVGDTFQAVHTILVPSGASTDGGLVQSAFFIVGMSCNVAACTLFPQGLTTAREKLVFWLDATTVLVAGGVMAWCFAVNPISPHVDRVTASLTAALVVVGAFSATKVALIPRPPMARIAAWPMVAAPVVQGVAAFLPGAFQSENHPYVLMVQLLPSLLIAVGPRIQELTVRTEGTVTDKKRKPYSLLPYGMVALTFVVFLITLPSDPSARLLGATTGVVVITALVAGRQLVSFQDNVQFIGRLNEQESRLREQASTDALTGLANRTRFVSLAASALASSDLTSSGLVSSGLASSGLGDGVAVTVLLIDLDDFKAVNDTMGHAAGDELLITVASRLRAAVRESDVVARLGGDEFAILLFEACGERVAEDILRRLAVPVLVEGRALVTRASVGVAVAASCTDPSVLLSNADIAMYEAKGRGKSTWVRYTDEMGARVGAEAAMIRELEPAVDAGQFRLLYQPIVRLADLRMTGVEALIRWDHPELGTVAPDRFVPVAERSGQIVPIGRWALGEACRQAARWQAGGQDLTVGVNVAGRQLRTPGFVEEVADVLRETGVPAARLSIEVTETAVLDDEESIEALLRLREMGVRLALDDFGTAASSLGLLLTCPVTTLKLDRSFVESITTVGRQAAVATAVSQMATALEFSSVAEGIETDEQRVLLQELGYEYGQGYLFSKPVAASEIGTGVAVVRG